MTARRQRGAGPGRASRGQASVEFALLLPLMAVLALAVVQVALVGRDRVLVTHAARVGARRAAVGAADGQVRLDVLAAAGSAPERTTVEVRRSGSWVTVRVAVVSRTEVPLVGRVLRDPVLVATAGMPLEPGAP